MRKIPDSRHGRSGNAVKTAAQDKCGPPEDVLRLREIEMPAIGNEELLVRVRGASVHADVWHAVTGWPYALRLMGAGLLRPKCPVPGADAAGIVEAVGKDVASNLSLKVCKVTLTPVIEKILPLDKVPEASRLLQEGRFCGKTILTP